MIEPVTAAAAGKAIVKATGSEPEIPPDMTKFLVQVSGGPMEVTREMLGTEIRLWAWKRQLTLLRKAQDHLRKLGKDPRKVNLNVLFPLLAAGGLEEDEEMADRWAALLANAADPAADEVPPSFPEVLKQLTPGEARLLDTIYSGATGDLTSLVQQLGLGSQSLVVVDNLVRLRLLRHPFRPGPVAWEDSTQAQVTEFGRAFVEACHRRASPEVG